MRLSILPAANINKIFALWLSFLLAVALTLTASRYLIDTADWHLYQFLYFYAFCFGNFFLINLAILAVGGGVLPTDSQHNPSIYFLLRLSLDPDCLRHSRYFRLSTVPHPH